MMSTDRPKFPNIIFSVVVFKILEKLIVRNNLLIGLIQVDCLEPHDERVKSAIAMSVADLFQ